MNPFTIGLICARIKQTPFGARTSDAHLASRCSSKMSAMTLQKSFIGSKTFTPARPAHTRAVVAKSKRSQRAVRVNAGFIGSPENIIIVASTTAFLVAGRFGLAPTVRQQATPGLRLVDNGTKGLSTGDPAGFTAVDVLGHGTMGHVIGVGAILSLRALGKI